MADTYILPVDGWADGAAPFSVPVQSVNPSATGSGRIPAYPLHELPDDNAVPIASLISGDTRPLYVPKYALGQGASPLGLSAGDVPSPGYVFLRGKNPDGSYSNLIGLAPDGSRFNLAGKIS